MDDTQKMLQVIINGQSSFRQEVLSKIDKLDVKLSGRIDSLDGKIDKVEKEKWPGGEMVNTTDLKSVGVCFEGSTPSWAIDLR